MKQKIAFLYLNTGGGHLAPARALASGLQAAYPDTVEPVLFNGFSEKMRVCRYFFEDGYQVSSNYFEAGYVLFYRLTEFPLAIRIGNYFVSIHGVRNLINFLREQHITKVVCMHEILILMAREAIDRVDPKIPLITLVTDPFTAHALWFYQKNMELVVFSEKLKKEAEERYGWDPQRVHSFPFILSRAFDRPYTPAEVTAAKKRLGIPEDKKILLIAGGGEGLKSADRLVFQFLLKKRPELLIVVCGKNKILRLQVSTMVDLRKAKNVRVYGFVSFMPDLLNCADCIITKGGASTVMEVLSVSKPVIFSTFIRGQELGNVLYAIHNGAGWFIRNPKKILEKAAEVLDNPELAQRIQRNVKRLGIRNGLDEVVSFIHSFKR
ncbi:MAG TPA: glycosyltransferase [Treponema sp.]|nr:glycosyltransferase [Treponema sp.]